MQLAARVRLRALQAEGREAKETGSHRKGVVKITLGYFKFLEDVDIREWQKPGQSFEAMAPPCGKPGDRSRAAAEPTRPSRNRNFRLFPQPGMG